MKIKLVAVLLSFCFTSLVLSGCLNSEDNDGNEDDEKGGFIGEWELINKKDFDDFVYKWSFFSNKTIKLDMVRIEENGEIVEDSRHIYFGDYEVTGDKMFILWVNETLDDLVCDYDFSSDENTVTLIPINWENEDKFFVLKRLSV